MKKSLLVLLSLFTLLLTGCDSWMSDDNFFSNIEKDVKVANASKISVYVRYAQTKQGKTDPEGYTTFKVKIPQSVTAVTEQEYGFVKWAAFSTDFLATGDKQSQNKGVIFVDEESYNKDLLPKEINSLSKREVVTFEDPTSPTTNVTINEVRNDIFIVPIVVERPKIDITEPGRGEPDVVRNITIRINFTRPMDEASFYTPDGVLDKITITQGIKTYSADGEPEFSSDDITDLFDPPQFSSSKKMITMRFNKDYIDEGFDARAAVNVTISKDVKDLYGYTMTDDDTISFRIGSQKDSLAPRITWLSGGVGEHFQDFMGMYSVAGAIESLGQTTKIELEGSTNAPVDNVYDEFYDQFLNNRVSENIVMRIFAEDLAGAGSGQSIDGIEANVSRIAIRLRHLYNADGTPDTESEISQLEYAIYSSQINNTSIKKSYRELVNNENIRVFGEEKGNIVVDSSHGCLYECDLSNLEDGLIQIDVAAVDVVNKNGFYDSSDDLASEYGNGWTTLFVIKDTSAPDAEANRAKVLADKSKAKYGFFNETLFKDVVLIQDANNVITDANNPKLASANSRIKWIVNPGKDKTWADKANLTADDPRWTLVSESISFTDVPLPEKDGPADFTYVLMDDMGNISKAVALESIIYDATVPAVGKLTWELDPGITLGVITGTVLDRQTLVIPVKDETSGLKTIDISIGKVGSDGSIGAAYATPFANSGLKVYIDDQELVAGTDYEVSGTKLTLIQPNEPFDSKIKIRGIQISDTVSEGSFVVEVNAIDAAFNKDISKRSSRLENDSTSPVIEKICVPEIDIKRGIEPSVGAAEAGLNEYWADYNKLDTTSINPKTNIYITLKEDSSGVKIFDFDSSTVKLTSSSKLYVLESGNADGEEPEPIDCDIDTFNNKLTITENDDAVLSPLNGSITVKITDLELSEKAARVNLSLYDIATNKSLDEEGSKFTLENANNTQISEFMYDKEEPVITEDSFYLRDRQLLAGSKPAEEGFTNEIYVDAGIEIEQGTPTGSGVYKITVDGAEFVKTGADKTTISVNAGNSELAITDFEISSDNKTITFTNTDNSCFTAFKNSYEISIKNLMLPEVDGNKNVTIKVTSIGGKESNVHAKSIILDTASPQWNDNGLYAYKDSGIDISKVYPHPSANDDNKAYGIKLSQNAQELYFYTTSKIAIAGDISDTNLNPQHLAITKTAGTISSSTAANNSVYNYTLTSDCTFTAYAYDKAGNKSTDITFHIVKDDLFASSPASIDEYMTLTMPQNGAIFRNALPSLTNYNQTGFDYVDSLTSASAMKAYNYVIKQSTSSYTIKIKLGSGINEADKNLVGETPAEKQTYEELFATGTSSPIEYYSISHWYDSYNSAASSASYVPLYPEASTKPKWHSYKKSSSRYSDVDVVSYIDSNGDIIIELPKTKNCPPLALLLKDGCGNTTYRMIKPVSMTDNSAAVAWIVDGVIGIGDNKQGRETFIYPSVKELAATETQTQGAVEIGDKLYMLNEASSPRYHAEITDHSGTSETAVSGMVKNPVEGVTYYNQSVFGTLPKLVLEAYNDTCFYAEPGAGNETEYTLKSRILAVPAASAAPTRSDFIEADDSTRASEWKYVKTSSTDSTIYMVHDYPTFDSTTPYKIYYIVEDKVGNYEINTIVNGDANNAYTLWMYDNVSPAVELSKAQKVNTIDGITYYSQGSVLEAEVTDAYSGIREIKAFEGIDPEVYSFEENEKLRTVTGLSAKATVNGKLVVETIKDFTGNVSSNIELINENSNQWIKQVAPTLSTENGKKTVIGPDNGQTGFCNTEDEGDITTGLIHNIKADRYLTQLNVQLKLDTHDTEQLLGWIVKSEPIEEEDFRAFYPSSLVQQADPLESPVSDGDTILTFANNTYSYVKTNSNLTWYDVHTDRYFYAVNKAGLICRAPIVIHFVDNPIPVISEAITYSDDITYSVLDSNQINYTETASTFTFVATKDPVKARLYYGNIYTDYTLSDYEDEDYTGVGRKYTLPLGETTGPSSVLRSLTDETLRLYLLTASEQSDEYQLNGNSGYNRWTFDETAPTFTLDTVLDSTRFEGDETYYLIHNPTIKFNPTDSDTEFYQARRIGDPAGYQDITNSVDDSTMQYALSTYGESSTETWYFRAVDRAGNPSEPIIIQIQKDFTPPQGMIGYEVQESAGVKADYATADEWGNVLIEENAASKTATITYNPAEVSLIALNPSVNDFGVGVTDVNTPATYLYFAVDTDNIMDSNLQPYTPTITLNSSWNGKKYHIVAKDRLNNRTIIKTFIFKSHGTVPVVQNENEPEYPELLTLPTYNGTTIKGFASDSAFEVRPQASELSEGERTILRFANGTTTLTLPVVYNSLPSKRLYYTITYNSVAIDDPSIPKVWKQDSDVSDGKVEVILDETDLANIKSRQTFLFVWYKDEVGNMTVHNITQPANPSQNWWTTIASQNVTAAPRLAANSQIEGVLKEADQDAQRKDDTHLGTFYQDDDYDNQITTITYNPHFVKTMDIPEFEVEHSGSGLPNPYLFYVIDTDDVVNANLRTYTSTINLGMPEDQDYSTWRNGKTYHVVAKDNIGHTAILKTFIFIAHGTEPALGTTLTAADPTNYELNASISAVVNVNDVTNPYNVRVFTGATASFTLPVQASSLPAASKDVHYKVTYNDNTTVPQTWSSAVDVGTSGKLENVTIDLTQISVDKAAPTSIYVWYRDAIGNTKVYNLPYPGTGVNKWLKDTTAPETGTVTGWTLRKQNDEAAVEANDEDSADYI
ncbi:MAG: Ig-like domain-containing protein, partial [Treponema sp.]|nr:Ig-like domain-containing protein [Treponema sp.]